MTARFSTLVTIASMLVAVGMASASSALLSMSGCTDNVGTFGFVLNNFDLDSGVRLYSNTTSFGVGTGGYVIGSFFSSGSAQDGAGTLNVVVHVAFRTGLAESAILPYTIQSGVAPQALAPRTVACTPTYAFQSGNAIYGIVSLDAHTHKLVTLTSTGACVDVAPLPEFDRMSRFTSDSELHLLTGLRLTDDRSAAIITTLVIADPSNIKVASNATVPFGGQRTVGPLQQFGSDDVLLMFENAPQVHLQIWSADVLTEALMPVVNVTQTDLPASPETFFFAYSESGEDKLVFATPILDQGNVLTVLGYSSSGTVVVYPSLGVQETCSNQPVTLIDY